MHAHKQLKPVQERTKAQNQSSNPQRTPSLVNYEDDILVTPSRLPAKNPSLSLAKEANAQPAPIQSHEGIPMAIHQTAASATNSSLERKVRRIPVLGAVFPKEL